MPAKQPNNNVEERRNPEPSPESDLDQQILRSQMLVSERETDPGDAGGMAKSPVDDTPVWEQPGGNPPPEERAHTVDAPPRSEEQIAREPDRLQYRGS